GNRLTLTDPLLHVTTWTWNSFNEPLSITCDDGHKTVNTYDTSANLTKAELKDALGNVVSTTTYAPNTDGTLQSKTDSNSHQTLYGYDVNGHLNKITTP